jgi:IPT/TIG domain
MDERGEAGALNFTSRRVAATVIAGLAMLSGSALTSPVAASSFSLPAPHPGHRLTSVPSLVRFQDVRLQPNTTRPPLAAQFIPSDSTAYVTEKQAVERGDIGRRVGVAAISTRQSFQTAGSPQTEQKLSGFPVMDLSRQLALYGSDQGVQPPDTQLAAGPTALAEAVNSTLSVWTKSGVFVTSSDLNVFFSVPGGYSLGDPRILYDGLSGRWYLSGLAFNAGNNNSNEYIAVSTSSDPTAAWHVYLLGSLGTGVLGDQPKIGVSSDKIVDSWNDFTTPAGFIGEQTWVIQKSDLLAGVSANIFTFALDNARFDIVPAQSMTSTSTEWLAYNNADCPTTCNTGSPTVGVIAINGTPLANDVTWTETDPSFNAMALPPNPRQPGGLVTTAIDDRFLSAIWQNGELWTSANDACLPSGDSTMRSCLRLGEILTGATPTVGHDFDASSVGVDLFYPAITLDSTNDLFIAFSESSSTLNPSAAAVASLAGGLGILQNAITIAPGLSPYSLGTTNRWGDYSAAATDPSNPADVWLTAEYQASATNVGDWGTATARLAIQPTIQSVNPSSGPVNVQQPVTIFGSQFQVGATVTFGGNAATNVAIVNPGEITAVAPVGAAVGPVDVTVSQPDGTSTTVTSGYTYVQIQYFNWFDKATPGMAGDNIHLLNTSGATATISLTMPGASIGPFTLPAGAETYVSFGAGHIGGPVVVTSDQQILSSQRVQYFNSFNEVWSMSAAQAAMVSYIPWYDTATAGMVGDNIHVLNPGAVSANVTVTLPGATTIGPFALAAGQETHVSFGPGHIGGPVKISATLPVLASQRVQYYQTFNEVVARSATQASTQSMVNWFDRASAGMVGDNIHVLNPGAGTANVTLTLPGAPNIGPFPLQAGQETYVSFGQGQIGGPVTITSSLPVLASQRVQYYQSFNEVPAATQAQASTVSHIMWFDKATAGMVGDNIHVLNMGAATANVTVSLPGATNIVFTLPVGAETYVTFPAGKLGGPVTITADQTVLAAQRVQYYQSFNEVASN